MVGFQHKPDINPEIQTCVKIKITNGNLIQSNGVVIYINSGACVEGLLPIPNGLAIPNTPPFMIDTDSMAIFYL